MNWFKRKKTEKIDAGSSILDTRIEHRASSIKHRASNFNAFLLLFLAFFTGILFLGTGILQSAPTTATDDGALTTTGTPAATGGLQIAAGMVVFLSVAQFQELINGKMGPFDLGLKKVRGNFFMVGNDQHGVARRGIVQNHVASFLTQETVSDFGKDFDGLTAGDVGECAHKTSEELHSHKMGAVRFLRDFEMSLFGRLEVARDGFADVGHSFRNGFALGHAPRQAGAFSDVPVVFGIVNKLNFEFHNMFLLCQKNSIMFLYRQGANEESRT